jgi:hypothetical protein
MEIISPRHWEHHKHFALLFEYDNMPGAGFSFDCDRQGNVLPNDLNPDHWETLAACQSGSIDGRAIHCAGVKDYSSDVAVPAVGRCSSCGRAVELFDPLTNACEGCGALYNGFGQELAPQSQWEETWDQDGQYAWGQGIGED